jgi:hypothetical protein
MAGKAQGAGRGSGDQVEGSPLAAGLVVFGAGLVVSSLLPTTAVESSVTQRATDTAKESAADSASMVRNEGQASADRVAPGLTPSQ